MHHSRGVGAAVSVFSLFFGLALAESLAARDWGLVLLFGALGALSVISDFGGRRRDRLRDR